MSTLENIIRSVAIAITLLAVAPILSAHHSRAAIYDINSITEIEGRVTRILWRNPHIRFWLESEIAGEPVIYEIESTPPGTLERHGISPEILSIGQTIRIAGTPGRFNTYAMEAKNILLPDGREVLIQRDSEPRWSAPTIGWTSEDLSGARINTAVARAEGIFRVWSRDEDSSFRVREGSSLSLVGLSDYPLTATARQMRQNFDPIADNPIPGCTPKGMPYIMGQPYPIEFINDSGRILMRIEEYDLVRVIHLIDEPGPSAATPLGYSVGRWDGGRLFVSTSAILAPQYIAGIPLTDSAQVEERFELSEDQTRLRYLLKVTDPGTFTDSVEREKYWTWKPGVEIKPYECTIE